MLYSDISLFTYVQIVVYFLNAAFQFYTCRASPVIRIVKLFTQHVVRGDYWVPTNYSLTVNGGVASLIAWLDHSCQKNEVGGKQGHAPCRRILLQ